MLNKKYFKRIFLFIWIDPSIRGFQGNQSNFFHFRNNIPIEIFILVIGVQVFIEIFLGNLNFF
jgi:hypothetical protein